MHLGVKEHFEKVSKIYHPFEICGFMGGYKIEEEMHLLWFVFITNASAAENKWDFVMHPIEQASFLSQTTPLAMIHTHPNGEPKPSKYDLVYKDKITIPYIIYSPHIGYKAYYPLTTEQEIHYDKRHFNHRNRWDRLLVN